MKTERHVEEAFRCFYSYFYLPQRHEICYCWDEVVYYRLPRWRWSGFQAQPVLSKSNLVFATLLRRVA